MLGSIFIGLSGMGAYSEGLRQISNNITNLNTTGFKSKSLVFRDLFGAAGANGSGQGVSLGSSRLDFRQGELRQTERDLDLAVDGSGMLVLLRNGVQYFTRTGSFEVNEEGLLVLAGGDYQLALLDSAGRPNPVSINANRNFPPAATTRISFADNLSSAATEFSLANLTVYNAEGASDSWSVRFERGAAAVPGEWTVIVTNGSGSELTRATLKFNNGIIDPATAEISVSDGPGGRNAILDFSRNVTSFSSGQVSTLRSGSIDGFASGQLVSVRVNAEGRLEAIYSNSQTRDLGAVAIAAFRNPGALQQRGSGLFESSDGEVATLLTSAQLSGGRVLSRRLEASNVDLSQQFGDLILVQRGYQASSQVVSVSNDMIQQLFGIRGQG